MFYNKIIIGKFINLRLVQEKDTEFILSLRLDPKLNKYLSKVENNIAKQKRWILTQQSRKGDYYFLITDKEYNPIGTISLYDIRDKEGYFGRWISKGNSVQAIESVILIHDFGFNQLDLDLIYSKTVVENTKAINFHKNFGATFTNEISKNPTDDFDLEKAIILKKDFENIKMRNYKIIDRFL